MAQLLRNQAAKPQPPTGTPPTQAAAPAAVTPPQIKSEKAQPTKQEILRAPTNIQESGISNGLITDLVLKTIYTQGESTATAISKMLCLPFVGIVQNILEQLDREQVTNITGSGGFAAQSYNYVLSANGVVRARAALERSTYVGPAPVPLERYNLMIRAQALKGLTLREEDVKKGFEGLAINPAMFDKIGPALNSGRSIFLYGPPGNGKTTIATRMSKMIATDPIYIPYAASVDGEIIKVYDDFNHVRRQSEQSPDIDARWVLIERPTVMVGGELTLASLDLIFDENAKYYEAPFQMKANGGLFLIDDFGRQQMDPQDLLNRWIVPLETKIDFMTLHNGKKIEIPFEQLVVFSTNLDPAKLVDQAFLRRIRHKIKVDDPSPEEFHRIFQALCQKMGVKYNQKGFVSLYQKHYVAKNRALKMSHPRDLLDQLLDITRYKGLPPETLPEYMDMAADAYFADL